MNKNFTEELTSSPTITVRAEGPWSDLALHSIGWKAFQDLCSQVCEVVLNRPVEIFQEAQDGGQDAVFVMPTDKKGELPVGSVQVKHSTDPRRKLHFSDFTGEFDKLENLVMLGQADTYVLITNMSIDAPTAIDIRKKMVELGVRKPHIFSRQFLVRSIRSSAKLRALVPQVYGIGDLSAILDGRKLEQTRVLLENLIPKLKVYVPTAAHHKAVNALNDHGVVLLLGNPSTGKSAIGAILTTLAAQNENHAVMYLTSPRDFDISWNPYDPGRFFWIDDAFGSNVMRDEYVQDWTAHFTNVQIAIAKGNRFLFTSRRHIYEAAKRRLGQKNLPVFSNGKAVVDVGDLTLVEKKQILYNHVNFGNQTQSWKKSVKPILDAVAAVDDFLPGIAERLGDSAFTKGLGTSEREMIRFMQEPREHLINTINVLDTHLHAALLLVYVHQGALNRNNIDDASAKAVSELTDTPLARILDSFNELKGSFLRVSTAKGYEVWSFAHPTIADALTEILKARPHHVTALLRGAPLETIFLTCVCEGAPKVEDALLIPVTLDDILVARLLKAPDELSENRNLFNFLVDRTSDKVFRAVISGDPKILERVTWGYRPLAYDPKITMHARALKMGLLEDYLRDETATRLEESSAGDFDISFFDKDDILQLIPPQRLVALGIKLRTETLGTLPEKISEIAADADLDEGAEGNFSNLIDGLDALENMSSLDDDTKQLVEEARDSIREAIQEIERKQEERENERGDWDYMSSVSRPAASKPATLPTKETKTRSIFDDVDC